MSITNITNPKLSPSLNEPGPAILTDENSNQLPLELFVAVDDSGNSGVAAAALTAGITSQVTARQQAPTSLNSDGTIAPVKALASIDPSSGKVISFVAPSAKVVNGKFQSAELTGTGASQNVAHGLGAVPSLVLASIQDSNGVSLPIAIAEGTHDGTNLKFTVTSGVKFKAIALL